MPPIRADAFERLLGSLSAGGLAAFVDDLWAARGWETSRRGPVVVAREGPGGREQRLVCVPSRRWRRQSALADRDPDVVVAARRTAGLVSAAHDASARFVGPEELRELALYGVDRATADRLFEAHFGRPVATEAADSPELPATGRASIAVALVAAVVVVGAVGGFFGGPGVPGGADRPAVTATPVAAATTAGGDSGSASDAYPPGVDRFGVVDADDLADAHARRVANRTYDLLVLHQGSVDLLDPGRAWATSRQTVDRVGPTRFHYRVTGIDLAAEGDDSLVIYDDYADGEVTYRRVAGTPSVTYRRGPLPGADGGAFTVLGEAYVARFLATTESHIEVIERPNRTRYRVTATGSPLRIGWPVANYTATAVVGEDGLIHRLAVEYIRLEPAGTHPDGSSAPDRYARLEDEVRFELVYRDLDQTSAPSPEWYDEARHETDETVLLRPPDSLWWTQPIGIDYDRG